MTTKPKTPFDNLMDVMVDELIAMTDAEVLESVDAAAVQAEGLEILNAAKAEAGRRRLAAAKAGIAASREQRVVTHGGQNITVEEARRYLARAANDSRYTLAARNLGELSDDEVLRLYSQIKMLEAGSGPDGATK